MRARWVRVVPTAVSKLALAAIPRRIEPYAHPHTRTHPHTCCVAVPYTAAWPALSECKYLAKEQCTAPCVWDEFKCTTGTTYSQAPCRSTHATQTHTHAHTHTVSAECTGLSAAVCGQHSECTWGNGACTDKGSELAVARPSSAPTAAAVFVVGCDSASMSTHCVVARSLRGFPQPSGVRIALCVGKRQVPRRMRRAHRGGVRGILCPSNERKCVRK